MLEKKRMIQVGCGGFGEYWLGTVIPGVAEFAQLIAAVDVNEEALKNAVKYAGLPEDKCYTDLDTALAENKADFVNVVVPPQFHEEVINKAIASGADIVCEKPLGIDIHACVRIYNMVKASGRKLAVTMSHRFEAEKQTVEALVKSNIYGPVNYVVSRLTMKRNFNEQLKEDRPEVFISNALIHNLDTIRGICGCDAKSVYANCWIGRPELSNAASGLVIIEMASGARAVLEESFANGSGLDGWSNEYLRAECTYATIEAHHRKVTIKSDMGYPYASEAKIPLMDRPYWDHALIIREFVDWLDGKEAPATNYEENIQCCALVYAAVESMKTGRAVDVQQFLENNMN